MDFSKITPNAKIPQSMSEFQNMAKVSGHIIVGQGEVGRSLYHVFVSQGKIAYSRDIEKPQLDIRKFAYLHICFPCGEKSKFIESVKEYIKEYDPFIIFIHSTVPVGTTREIGENCVHTPVRGKHPYLEAGLKTFVKYFGYQNERHIPHIISAFSGFKTFFVKNPDTTELGKILDTTRYGWEIVFAKEVKRICDQYGVDFDLVYSEMNKTYNQGYEELGYPEFRRSLLKAMPGKIGGHCVVENSSLLDDFITQTIIERNKLYELEGNK